ncbi:DUF4239 domain-containing protein [Hyalangium minutum]|uniref:DUF4239 domain-containing protein n=1 Tax=Hyalangium minutum TaxID=394096 RepID=A0A085WAY4_9BACT|nr:DUF4239 domain-containing protein [Hyalangium minutum]KFE64847.1 hypothetical protein DB31_1865 [Hyalangium minutum]
MLQPALFLSLSFVLLFASGWAGSLLRERKQDFIPARHKEHFNSLETSVLGMLALLLGFTFSMAVSRHDGRRKLVVDEANAIGTTWLRTSILPEPQRAGTRTLLRRYVDVRMRFGSSSPGQPEYGEVLQQTAALQQELWQSATEAMDSRRDALMASYIASLNEAIDVSEERTAALENRIPHEAWGMLGFFSLAATFIVGLAMPSRSTQMLLILPAVISCALTLVLDLDAPRRGLIRVDQSSMQRIQHTLQGP